MLPANKYPLWKIDHEKIDVDPWSKYVFFIKLLNKITDNFASALNISSILKGLHWKQDIDLTTACQDVLSYPVVIYNLHMIWAGKIMMMVSMKICEKKYPETWHNDDRKTGYYLCSL